MAAEEVQAGGAAGRAVRWRLSFRCWISALSLGPLPQDVGCQMCRATRTYERRHGVQLQVLSSLGSAAGGTLHRIAFSSDGMMGWAVGARPRCTSSADRPSPAPAVDRTHPRSLKQNPACPLTPTIVAPAQTPWCFSHPTLCFPSDQRPLSGY
eukprot:197592-Prorocentrum_minimum.AAC.3